jgi:hypothetical protein
MIRNPKFIFSAGEEELISSIVFLSYLNQGGEKNRK